MLTSRLVCLLAGTTGGGSRGAGASPPWPASCAVTAAIWEETCDKAQKPGETTDTFSNEIHRHCFGNPHFQDREMNVGYGVYLFLTAQLIGSGRDGHEFGDGGSVRAGVASTGSTAEGCETTQTEGEETGGWIRTHIDHTSPVSGQTRLDSVISLSCIGLMCLPNQLQAIKVGELERVTGSAGAGDLIGASPGEVTPVARKTRAWWQTAPSAAAANTEPQTPEPPLTSPRAFGPPPPTSPTPVRGKCVVLSISVAALQGMCAPWFGLA